MMLTSFFNSRNSLRHRFTSGRRYEALAPEPPQKESSARGAFEVAPDSVSLSDSRPSSEPPREPLLLEHLNRETLAFGMVCPKQKPLKGAENQRLTELIGMQQSEIVAHSDDDSFLHAKHPHEHRLLGFSITRDKAGGVAFHIYELPETPPEHKTFGPFSYTSAVRHIRGGIEEACDDGFIFDKSGEIVTKDYTVVQMYDPRLLEAETRGQAEYARHRAEYQASYDD